MLIFPTILFLTFIYLFIYILGPCQHHMDVPRLGVELELQLPGLHHSHSNTPSELHVWLPPQFGSNSESLTNWARPGIEPISSWILVGFLTHWATARIPIDFLFYFFLLSIISQVFLKFFSILSEQLTPKHLQITNLYFTFQTHKYNY